MRTRNVIQGDLIHRALRRASRAAKEGFYLEAIALCDSLMTDRVSKVMFYSLDFPPKFTGINGGLQNLLKHKVVVFDPTLVEETRAWGALRNAAIHGISKFEDFSGDGWRTRLKALKSPASQGVSLSKRWLVEAAKHRL
jgi:hypothetical protein